MEKENKEEQENRLKQLAEEARDAFTEVSLLSEDDKNSVLKSMIRMIKEDEKEILEANRKDIINAEKEGKTKAIIDRLRLTKERIESICSGIEDIMLLPDPIGEVLEEKKLSSGISMKKVRVPLGTILLIFEARPNVVVDAFALCFKAGNVPILKGGSDAKNSNEALAGSIKKALESRGVTDKAIQLVSGGHEEIDVLLRLSELIDLVIPRGGENLIRSVVEKAKMPVIMHYKGLCHTYIDKDADPKIAVEVSLNAKVQRPGVCNAMETLLIARSRLNDILPELARKMDKTGVELRADEETAKALSEHNIPFKLATDNDWDTEYLDLILSIKAVDGVDEAIKHINRHGSKHSEAIITENKKTAERFSQAIDASSVFVNCSTRFNDGFEYGLGAEIGISTQKIHARGPMGLKELTTYKYLLKGSGEVRK